jgi:hypothetical protein
MKLLSVLQGQVVRLGKISGPDGGGVYGLNLTKACEERYGFLQGPRALSEFDLSKGITFLHGYFQNQHVIDRFQVYENGILAEARIDTDICESFLDDAVAWVANKGGVKFDRDPNAPRLYQSNLEIESTVRFSIFERVAPIGGLIAEALRSYNQNASDWEMAGISFGTVGPGDAASFKFERREGPSVPLNVFFSASRMRTKDHLRILRELETLLTTNIISA